MLYFAEASKLSTAALLPLCFTKVCPQSLQFSREVLCGYGDYCRSVNFTPNGDLLVGCSWYAMTFDAEKWLLKNYVGLDINNKSLRSLIETRFNNEPLIITLNSGNTLHKLVCHE